jgi:nucleotide-binding universal stress UspA family protein
MNSSPDTRHILVAHDFSEFSDAALDYGLALAAKFGARVTVVHVYDVPSLGAPEVLILATDWTKQFGVVARESLDQVVAQTRERGVAVEAVLRRGTAWREVVAVAEEVKADLIVVGTEGRRGVTRALLGSVAERIARMATCSVLVARRPTSKAPSSSTALPDPSER